MTEENNNITLLKILSVAKEEFFKKDYQNASLRDISKKAGVTTGAFYGYFKNKEELLDALVGKEYETLIEYYKNFLNEFASIPPQQKAVEMLERSHQGMIYMVDYIYDYIDEFKIMLCHSKGTKYENLVHTMAMLDIEATHDFVNSVNKIGKDVKGADEIVEHIITTGMFSALFELVIHDVEREKAKEYALTLMKFYHAGWQEIMGF